MSVIRQLLFFVFALGSLPSALVMAQEGVEKKPEQSWVTRLLETRGQVRLVGGVLDELRKRPEERPIMEIDLKTSSFRVLKGERVALTCQVSVGRRIHEIAQGAFKISGIEKGARVGEVGDFVDHKGRLLVEEVHPGKDARPSGARFAERVQDLVVVLKGEEETTIRLRSGRTLGGAVTAGDIILPPEAAKVVADILKEGDQILIR